MTGKLTENDLNSLARSFNMAVENQMKTWPTPKPEQEIRDTLLEKNPNMSEDRIQQYIDEMKKVEFLFLANEEELDILITKDLIKNKVLAEEMGMEELSEAETDELEVLVAEVYAALAIRANKTDEFKACIPEGAKTKEVREALKEIAPSFVKLSM